jgi:alpha-glucosidase
MTPKKQSNAQAAGVARAAVPASARFQAQAAAAAQLVAKQGSYIYQEVNGFTPNQQDASGKFLPWQSIGNVVAAPFNTAENSIVFSASNGVSVKLYALGSSAFRIRFNPAPNADYSTNASYAVVSPTVGPVNPQITSTPPATWEMDLGDIQVKVNLLPFLISVYRGSQLIHADTPGQGVFYIPGQEVIANFKNVPTNAQYYGLGEKAGALLAKNGFTTTFFNYDNFMYGKSLPNNPGGGPLDPREPLYSSMPFLIEVNPNPVGAYAGAPYAYGLFFDNSAQSYFNIAANDYSNMSNKYYFGALYGDLDYYFMAGNSAADVLPQLLALTGAPAMPPKYALGYHQGCYGYYDSTRLQAAANAYRNAQIPIDGLHIDIDFQNNYRTFTSSDVKFPNVSQVFADLHQNGFKCSTNITSMITCNPLDENGNPTSSYAARDTGVAQDVFLYDVLAGETAPAQTQFIGTEDYGCNTGGFNPFIPKNNPTNFPNLNPANTPSFQSCGGDQALGGSGYYPDLGDPAVQAWWGQNYQYLLSVGLDMIWQDMTCPAQVQTSGTSTSTNENETPDKTFPLDLMMYDSRTASYVPNAKIHNAYALNLVKATSAGLNTLRPNVRNFIIARGGYAGMHRYAALWTGDSASSWDFLRVNLPEVLNLGLSGQPLSGCDIGGFAGGSGSVGSNAITNYELFTRWMHLGAFLPWYRNHYDGYGKGFQEPYNYGDPVPANCRKYVEMRYRMLQIFYDAMYQTTQTGLPIARALFLNFPNDAGLFQGYPAFAGVNGFVYTDPLSTQFMVGDSILIAPMLDPHETDINTNQPLANPTTPLRPVYLPNGPGAQWYAYQDNQAPLLAPVPGGSVFTYSAGLELVPIYIKAGAILPMRELEQFVGQLAQNPLTFNIYPGADSTYTLYEDDGTSTAAQTSKAYRTTQIGHTGIPNGQSIQITRTFDNFTPPQPFYYVSLLGTNAPSSVVAAGSSLPNLGDSATLAASPSNAYYFNASLSTTFVKIFDVTAALTLTITF